ncbi:hypothetical protein MferCBS31731_002810 [Microsporum ferrugineum]
MPSSGSLTFWRSLSLQPEDHRRIQPCLLNSMIRSTSTIDKTMSTLFSLLNIATHMRLHLTELQGTFIPEYYGSFTLELPVDGYQDKRLVRLTFIELVQGVPMRKLDPKDMSQQQRQQIMKRIIDAETAVFTRGMLHCDTFPRNIIINSDPGSNRRVVLIDFDLSRPVLEPFVPAELISLICLPGPASPLLRWHRLQWPYLQREFDGWIDWDWQVWLEENYEDPQGSITDKMREFWLPENPERVLRMPGLKIW